MTNLDESSGIRRPTRAFRLFVSSTFSDLREERNALQQKVFPKLQEICHRRGARFLAIDLRWGVPEEAALDHRTVEICLDEIDRCRRTTPRPNFLILLGDRYGWRPLPSRVPADMFAAITAAVVTDTDRAMLLDWYSRDDNAVPPTYRLRGRAGVFVDPEVWEVTEARLRAILSGLMASMASATEQEILYGALDAPTNVDQVLCVFRSTIGIPVERTGREFLDLDDCGRVDPDAQGRLTRLKTRLRDRFSVRVHEYDAQWTGNGPTTAHLASLCDDVLTGLSEIIGRELDRLATSDPLEEEVGSHLDYIAQRARVFVGRGAAVNRLLDHLDGSLPGALVVTGPPGAGKSALLARAIEIVRAQRADTEIVARFIGVTPGSTQLHGLLEGLCREIARRYGSPVNALLLEPEGLEATFSRHLALATADRPLALVLDGLDQLSDVEALQLGWLPAQLPPDVRLVVSTRPGACADALNRRSTLAGVIEIDALGTGEAAACLDEWLLQARRSLRPEQRRALLEALGRDARPLHVRLAFEVARGWTSLDRSVEPPRDMTDLLRQGIGLLVGYHGEQLVSRTLGFLAAARQGLSEDELLDVLSKDEEVLREVSRRAHHPLPEPRLPVAIWARLSLDLQPYLTERLISGIPVLTFHHQQIRHDVSRMFLSAPAGRERHAALSLYFAVQANSGLRPDGEGPDHRALMELPYQLAHARLGPDLERLLTDFSFIAAKCAAGLIDDLVEDYRRAGSMGLAGSEAFQAWATFIQDRSHLLRRGDDRWPANRILLQLAIENAPDSPVTAAAGAWLATEQCDWMWLRKIGTTASPIADACVRVFEGHRGAVNGAAMLPDGRLLSWSNDGTLRAWDRTTGRVRAVLVGHAGAVTGALPLDGVRLLSWGTDGTVRVWDGVSGALLRTFAAHRHPIAGALPLPGERVLSWVSTVTTTVTEPTMVGNVEIKDDVPIRRWDIVTGAEIEIPGGQSEGLGGVFVLGDGRIASWGFSEAICLRDVMGDRVLATLNHEHVTATILISEGRLVSLGIGEIRVWDLETARSLFQVRTSDDNGALEWQPGQLVSWGEEISLWDLRTGKRLRRFERGADRDANDMREREYLLEGSLLAEGLLAVRSNAQWIYICDLNNGKMLTLPVRPSSLVGLSNARLLSLPGLECWEARTGRQLGTLEGHDRGALGALMLDDGMVLSWSADTTLRMWAPDQLAIASSSREASATAPTVRILSPRQTAPSFTSATREHDFALWRSLLARHPEITALYLTVADRAASSDGVTLQIWTPEMDRPILKLTKADADRINVMGDGRLIGWRFGADALSVWETATGKRTLFLPGAKLRTMTEQFLVTGDRDIWGRDGRRVGRLPAPEFPELHPLSGDRLVSWGWGTDLTVWDASTAAALVVLRGNETPVYGVLELENGRLLSRGSGEVCLWDGCTGALVTALRPTPYMDADGARLREDGRLLTWTNPYQDQLFELRDLKGVTVLESCGVADALKEHPSWWAARAEVDKDFADQVRSVSGAPQYRASYGLDKALQASFGQRFTFSATGALYRWTHGPVVGLAPLAPGNRPIAAWHGSFNLSAEGPLPDGTIPCRPASGQPFLLGLFAGRRRVDLTELDRILRSQPSPEASFVPIAQNLPECLGVVELRA